MELRDDGLSQRLNGLLEKRKFEEERRKLVSESLRNGAIKSKKIVFKDSDEEDEMPSNKKLTLFEDDEEPELNSQNPAELLQNRFSGYKGEKLTEMEAHYSHDHRFKVDERFLDDSGDDFENDAEKKSQFAILSSVLGHEVKTSLTKSKKKDETVRPFQRFDPDNPQHMEWMQNQKQHIRVQNKPLINAEEFNRELNKEETKVVEGHFYEVDEGFAKELQKNIQNRGEEFSFLSLMGRTSTAEENPDTSIFEKLLLSQPTEVTPMFEKITPLTDNIRTSIAFEKPFFFVYPFDDTSKKVLNTFRRQQELSKVKRVWQTHRDKTEAYYKSLVKTHLRLKEKAKKQNLRGKHEENSRRDTNS